ncbi:MAG: prepilin-type N-terminal cleavage/methylation domain-containing protein [Gammaproteobacteria bacterium]|nr:prepilin-type N-terminal cleavage/methylation domain-containing protein [Gammaproteobacteria bacterium]
MDVKKVKGFTLIELMMVVTIIGVLSWMAVPKYKNHLLRTTASTQSISAIRPIQYALSEYVAYNGSLPSDFNDLATVGFVNHSGKAYTQASEFVNGAVSAVDITFPSDDENTLLLSVSFDCKELKSDGCTRIAPKALQPLTLEISAILQQNSGAIRYFIDASKTNNLSFRGFLPRL